MERGTHIYAVPITYIDYMPDDWFKHFDVKKSTLKNAFRDFDYMTVYVTLQGKCQVYFRYLDDIKDEPTYTEPSQIKEVIFNTIMEYEG